MLHLGCSYVVSITAILTKILRLYYTFPDLYYIYKKYNMMIEKYKSYSEMGRALWYPWNFLNKEKGKF